MSFIEVIRAILVILAWRNLLDGDFARVEPVSDRQLEVRVYGASSEVRGLVNSDDSYIRILKPSRPNLVTSLVAANEA